MSTDMKKEKQKLEIKQQRCFSEEFKKTKVKDLVEKRITIREICKLYDVSRSAVYKWLYRFSKDYQKKSIFVVQMESEAHKTMRLQQQVAELERAVGQKQLEIDFLNKLIEIGSGELGFDLKKNFSPKPSNGIGSTGKNTDIK
jgi:transposase